MSKKLGQDLRPKEIKPSIVNKQCVVYNFSCDLCDADYVGYTARHLHQRIAEHKNSAIGRHFLGTVRYLCLRGGRCLELGGKIFKINEKRGVFF